MDRERFPLRMIAWELTTSCNLACIHCRAKAGAYASGHELSAEECRRIMDGIAAFSTPTIILTGGEPMLRPDIEELIAYGSSQGLRMVMAANGTLLDSEKARRLKTAGIVRLSISLDGKDASVHDAFRGVSGAFDAVMAAARACNEAGLPFQVNTTATRLNVADLGGIYDLARQMSAAAWHVFMLVPVGRGEGLKAEELNAATYEEVLQRLYDLEEENRIEMKVTCAPHYYRVVKEKGGTPKSAGCLAGKSFLFISHDGIAQPCGYLEWACGDIRKDGVRKVWEDSAQLALLRDFRNYKGKCGRCRYLRVCGGCRARAKQVKGDPFEAEPYCSYDGRAT